MTNSKIEAISLKIDNGGEALHYDDMAYLLQKIRDAYVKMQRIAMIANTAHDNTHFKNPALDTIKMITSDFLGK